MMLVQRRGLDNGTTIRTEQGLMDKILLRNIDYYEMI
jgi:hypothetical protein